MHRTRASARLLLPLCLLCAVSSTSFAAWVPPDVPVETSIIRYGHFDGELILDPTSGILSLFRVSHGLGVTTGRVGFDGTPFLNWGGFYKGYLGSAYRAVRDDTGGLLWVINNDAQVPNNQDIYLYRTLPGGGDDPAFNPLPIAADPDTNEVSGRIVSDGAGGALVAYIHYPYFSGSSGPTVKHVLSDGTFDPAWPAAGVRLSSQGYADEALVVLPDGANGMYAAWLNLSGMVMTRLTASGTFTPNWPYPGTPIGGIVLPLQLLPGDADHILAFWKKLSGNGNEILMGRVHVDGYLDGAPLTLPAHPTNLRIVSDLHGGAFVAWMDGADVRVLHYQPDGALAPGWPAAGASVLAGITGQETRGLFATPYKLAVHDDGGLTVAWPESLGTPGRRARLRWILPDGTIDPDQPDSGQVVGASSAYSYPLAVIGNGSGGVYVLWDDYVQPDFVSVGATLWLTEVDQQHIVDVPRTVTPGPLSLSAVRPNPTTGPATIRFRLSGDAPARMEVLDIAGRLVDRRTVMGAGDHVERLDRIGAWPPGVYCIRVSQGGVARTTRFVVTH